MIQANELRVGNWVEAYGKVSRILSVSTHPERPPHIRYFVKGDERIHSTFLNDDGRVAGIPLSQKILVKAGFAYIKIDGITRISDGSDEAEEGDTLNWTLNVKQSDYCDSFRFEIVKWRDQDYFTFSHQWLRVRFKYVHQLQNLHHSLTQTELTLNLS